MKALREENMSLQHALAVAQHSASTHRNALTTLTQERDALRKKVGVAELFLFYLSYTVMGFIQDVKYDAESGMNCISIFFLHTFLLTSIFIIII